MEGMNGIFVLVWQSPPSVEHWKQLMPPGNRARIGVITSGSLAEGLCARLDGRESVEDMRVGQFVVVQGERHEFFCMITDVVLEATNQKVLVDPPNGDLFFHEVLAGTSTYGTVALKPML